MLDRLFEQIFGSRCLLCLMPVGAEDGHRQLCPHCVAALPWRQMPELPLAGFSRAFAPLAYQGAARSWVLAAKRASGLVAARTLGLVLAESLLDAYPLPASRPDLLIPVPLSPLRLRRRGHNQALLSAAPVARLLGLPLARNGARRVRHTPMLAELDADARANTMAGAFAVSSDLRGRCETMGQRVAVIDDVVTTGSTAASLARALTDAGAKEVHLWAATAAEE